MPGTQLIQATPDLLLKSVWYQLRPYPTQDFYTNHLSAGNMERQLCMGNVYLYGELSSLALTYNSNIYAEGSHFAHLRGLKVRKNMTSRSYKENCPPPPGGHVF
ncbi:hypothetical protein DPMN_058710 [Dreissena polymorpha]|uniref:Uncharacterized protein n=1 Tax=Dreissena polymorpha TaxID=45954 RepID=A0A9D4C2P3_DREPO|nr:hypothetical protein DPMN_058710 [Dreissena polymorpha]